LTFTRPYLLASVLLASCLPAAETKPAPTLTTDQDKVLYAIGLAVGQNLSGLNLSAAEYDLVVAGLNDAAMKREPQLKLADYGPQLQQFVQTRQAQAAEAAAATEKVEADKFLATAAKEKGAVVKPSGLVITELTPGAGKSPAATDRVTVHYHGTLRDGKVFDSSKDRGQPASFGLNQVIACWTEGLQLMKVGGKSRLVCPADIAYGNQGRPPVISPGAALSFEVELLSIDAAPSGQ
jgi:FKBP-type peptidyl-prolyl cis-trans isomerase FkpA